MVTAHVIFIQADFDDEGSTNAVGAALTGEGDDGGLTVLVPSFFPSMPLTDRLVVGLGVHSPYGLSSDYSDDWVGRYHATRSELITVNINPSIGVNPAFGIGNPALSQQADGDVENEADDWGFGFNVGVLLPCAHTRRHPLQLQNQL